MLSMVAKIDLDKAAERNRELAKEGFDKGLLVRYEGYGGIAMTAKGSEVTFAAVKALKPVKKFVSDFD